MISANTRKSSSPKAYRAKMSEYLGAGGEMFW
jgi:hypothetical protein